MSLTRAYAVVSVKDFLAGGRRFTGIASTVATDRANDIVMPAGMKAKLPVPLLWMHDHTEPVGWVRSARVSDTDIQCDFEIATIHEPGPLRDRVDTAWQSIAAGLVRGLSIGFKPLPGGVEPIAGGGSRFTAWELLEVSAVTVPANAQATITEIKAADQALRRAAEAPADAALAHMRAASTSTAPVNLGALASVCAAVLTAVRARDARIDVLKGRLDKVTQQLGAAHKMIAALQRARNE